MYETAHGMTPTFPIDRGSWLAPGAMGAAARRDAGARAALERRAPKSITIVIDCNRFYYKVWRPLSARFLLKVCAGIKRAGALGTLEGMQPCYSVSERFSLSFEDKKSTTTTD